MIKTPGVKIKNYKGVNIYTTVEGMFFCDCVNNSQYYQDKTFNSEKLQSLEKVIDNYKGNSSNELYYQINAHIPNILTFKAVSKVGNRLLFEDGTSSLDYSRRDLYHESIVKNKKEFKDILELVNKAKILQDEQAKISKELAELRTKIKDLKFKL